MTQTRSNLLRQIMSDAWALAHSAARRFGGRAVQYFRETLKEAWGMAKPAPVEAPAAEPTVEGLVGRTVSTGYGDIVVEGTRCWRTEDGSHERVYLNLTPSKDHRKTVCEIYLLVNGSTRDRFVETHLGTVCYKIGQFCNSHAKRDAARRAVETLFA